MRRIVLAMMLAAVAQGAQAADFPDLPVLRGSLRDGLRPARWQGFYVGGQVGYGAADMNFTGSNSAMTARLLANTVIENDMQVSGWPLFMGRTSERQTGYGGFAGYNGQWGDVVLGLEANYLHANFNGNSTASASRISGATLSDGQFHAVTASSTAAMQITDMGTIRGRAGYVYGSFMPYLFGGFALGSANISKSVTVSDQWGPTQVDALAAVPVTLTASETKNNQLLIGYSAGAGVDVLLAGGLFARAEYEYVRFTGSIDTNISTVRGGLGYRF
jgi:opacity protein-like surface antigen